MKKIVLLIISFILLLSACNPKRIDTCNPIFVMDTVVNITFYNVDDYKVHYETIKDIYQDVDKVSNDFESNISLNGLYDLNEKRSIIADDLLIELIKCAVDMKIETNGFYNPFVGRLARLWKAAINDNKILADEIIKSEIEIMNNTSVKIEGNNVTLIGKGNLDFGGIAKGFATQKAKEYLDSKGINGYMINAGNSNVVYGKKFEEPFKIGFTKPYDEGMYTVVETENNAIGTSSPKYQFVEIEGIKYHHLLNPFTGYPVNYYDSVNVLCEDSILCDVYSTAIFVMDIDIAKDFASNKNIEVILYKNNEIIYYTDGWKMI